VRGWMVERVESQLHLLRCKTHQDLAHLCSDRHLSLDYITCKSSHCLPSTVAVHLLEPMGHARVIHIDDNLDYLPTIAWH
jgi:hypothetical protein